MGKFDTKYLKGISLVAGTCIGAGMIGIPVQTSQSGLLGTLIALLLVCGVMITSALLFLEASLAFNKPVNLISMTNSIFGKYGQLITWLICILFMYSVMVAYVVGGSGIVRSLEPELNRNIASVLFVLPFALIIYSGSAVVSLVNRILVLGVILSFIILCISILLFKNTQLQPIDLVITFNQAKLLLPALPLIVITFGYHEIIPPLTNYLERKISPLKLSIVVGTLLPLIVYLCWEVIILLLIPRAGAGGLIEILLNSKNPANSLIDYIFQNGQNKMISMALSCFSFFALISCLTSSAWALFDFLADGLKINKEDRSGKIILCLAVFIPAIIYTIFNPEGFLKALSLAGGFSAILMIIYPVIMVWMLRYKRKHIVDLSLIKDITAIEYQAPLNQLGMLMVCGFAIVVVVIEIINNLS